VGSLIVPLFALFGGAAIVALIVFLNPDKVEQWIALGWKLIDMVFRRGKKAYITHDVQGRVNEFARELNKEAPHCQAVGIKLEWVETSSEAQNFIRNGRLVVRMHRDDDNNRNFVNASMIFVSKALLPKAKRYLSPTQRESVDLFVGKKLFEAHKPEVVDVFFDEHFSPRALSSDKMQGLLDDYSAIDRMGIFFCVYVRELAFLGEKVFFGPRTDQIIVEVSDLVSFLRGFADREVGTQVPLELRGAYCRSGIMIVALRFKRELGDTSPYVKRVGLLLDTKLEQIYLLGSAEPDNKEFIEAIAKEASARFGLAIVDRRSFRAAIRMPGGERREVTSHLVVLRSPNVRRVYDKEYQDEFVVQATTSEIPIVEADSAGAGDLSPKE
jgi:hypothetical protein